MKYKRIKAPSSGKPEIPKEFHLGLKKLAERLQIQVHDRAPVTIEACRIVIEKIVQEPLDRCLENLFPGNFMPKNFLCNERTFSQKPKGERL